MSNPNELPRSPELPLVTPEDYFADAHRGLKELRDGGWLKAVCVAEQIPYTDGIIRDPRYWDEIANTAYKSAETARSTDGGDPRRIAMQEVTAAAADYVLTESFLNDRHRRRIPKAAYMQLKDRANHFNRLVEAVAVQFPELTVKALTNHLVGTANICLGRQRQNLTYIRRSVDGVRQVLAFTQALEVTGRGFEQSSIAEDQAGIDYWVEGDVPDTWLKVDVKSRWADAPGDPPADGAGYTLATDNIITIAELISYDDLGGRFFLPEALAIVRGQELDGILHAASQKIAQREQWRAAGYEHVSGDLTLDTE